MTIPCAWDVTVPTDFCATWGDYPQATKDSALWLASTWLWGATGRRYGVCPTTVRPSQSSRGELGYQTFAHTPGAEGLGVPGGPFLFSGRWFNAGCASACCGSSACAVVLRGPVAEVDEVLVGEEIVAPSAYRVDVTGGAWLLVRTDGECWPACQNMTAGPGEADTFEVTYGLGTVVPEALAIATAILACEYAKHLTGGVCSLPAKMTRLSRQGVEVEVAPPDPASGTTGIKMVDDVVSTLNPGKLRQPPRVMSLDLPEGCDRFTTWVGGSV
jgi:hypothetical protein